MPVSIYLALAVLVLSAPGALAQPEIKNDHVLITSPVDVIEPGQVQAVAAKAQVVAAALAKVPGVIPESVQVQRKESIHFYTLTKRADETLEDFVVKKLQGCISYDEACKRMVRNLNRRKDAAIDDSFAGEITAPGKAIQYAIQYSIDTPKHITFAEQVSGCGSINESSVKYIFLPLELKTFLDQTYASDKEIFKYGTNPLMAGNISRDCSVNRMELVWIPQAQLKTSIWGLIRKTIEGTLKEKFPGTRLTAKEYDEEWERRRKQHEADSQTRSAE
jgi:hypothetical protein